jgi:hypothetical protein
MKVQELFEAAQLSSDDVKDSIQLLLKALKPYGAEYKEAVGGRVIAISKLHITVFHDGGKWYFRHGSSVKKFNDAENIIDAVKKVAKKQLREDDASEQLDDYLSQDEAMETLEVLLRMLPKETEPQLVKMHGMNHGYIKGHLGDVTSNRGLTTPRRWYRLEYVNGQWSLMTTTPTNQQLYSYFPDTRVEKAVDTIKNLYADMKRHHGT